MKVCSKCHIAKEESEYFIKNKSTGRLHTQCKSCYKKHRKTYYQEHYRKYGDAYRARAKKRRAKIKQELQAKLLDYMDGKSCVICGEKDICVLEFDHIDPNDKAFPISRGISDGYDWNKILTEIKKCRILCANCHKKHTAKQQNWFKASD